MSATTDGIGDAMTKNFCDRCEAEVKGRTGTQVMFTFVNDDANGNHYEYHFLCPTCTSNALRAIRPEARP
jgi:hypothetical protein